MMWLVYLALKIVVAAIAAKFAWDFVAAYSERRQKARRDPPR